MASPLLISANIRNMSAENLATYSNAEVIAIDQDVLGLQGTRLVGGNLVPASAASAALAHAAARDDVKGNRKGGMKIAGKRWYTPGYTGSDGPATVLPCNADDPGMQWHFGAGVAARGIDFRL